MVRIGNFNEPPLRLGLLIQSSTLDDTVPTSHDCPTPYLPAKIGPKPFGPASSPCYSARYCCERIPLIDLRLLGYIFPLFEGISMFQILYLLYYFQNELGQTNLLMITFVFEANIIMSIKIITLLYCKANTVYSRIQLSE